MGMSRQQCDEARRPAETLSFPSGGGKVEVSIWENQNGDRVSYAVTVQRVFFDKAKKEWRRTGSLFTADIPVALYALQEAYGLILDQAR